MAKIRAVKAFHEAGHAVVARALGVEVAFVSMKPTAADNSASVHTHTATWLSRGADRATQIEAAEKDAMVALGGVIAEHRSHPGYPVQDEIETDLSNVQNYVNRAAVLAAGIAIPDHEPVEVTVAEDVEADIAARLDRLIDTIEALVSRKWASVERVAKALECHDRIDQAELDRLIAVTEGRPPRPTGGSGERAA